MNPSLAHRRVWLHGAPDSRGWLRVICTVAVLLVHIPAAGCQERDRPGADASGPLLAYTLPKTPWFQPGDVSFVVTKGQTAIKTWTKHVGAAWWLDRSLLVFDVLLDHGQGCSAA